MKIPVLVLLMAMSLMPCSAQPPAPKVFPPAPRIAVKTRAVPLPDYSTDLPLEKPDESRPRMCQLGTSCQAMDKRPFTACLLDSKHCDGTPPVTMLVVQPKPAKPAAR